MHVWALGNHEYYVLELTFPDLGPHYMICHAHTNYALNAEHMSQAFFLAFATATWKQEKVIEINKRL